MFENQTETNNKDEKELSNLTDSKNILEIHSKEMNKNVVSKSVVIK